MVLSNSEFIMKNHKKGGVSQTNYCETPPFSFFKSVNLVGKSDDTQNLSAAGALAKVKVSSYTRM